jgi:hypothetical protein
MTRFPFNLTSKTGLQCQGHECKICIGIDKIDINNKTEMGSTEKNISRSTNS